MNNDPSEALPPTGLPVQSIAYIHLIPGGTVGSQVEILYREGLARVILPAEGIVIEGNLLDCPEFEAEMGWVVVEGDKGVLAMGSPGLRELMIENSPCRLRLESVFSQNPQGSLLCDWRAFELSPNGACIQVSDDRIGDSSDSPS